MKLLVTLILFGITWGSIIFLYIKLFKKHKINYQNNYYQQNEYINILNKIYKIIDEHNSFINIQVSNKNLYNKKIEIILEEQKKYLEQLIKLLTDNLSNILPEELSKVKENSSSISGNQNQDQKIWVKTTNKGLYMLEPTNNPTSLYLIKKDDEYRLNFTYPNISDIINLYSDIMLCPYIPSGNLIINKYPIYEKDGEYYVFKSKGEIIEQGRN